MTVYLDSMGHLRADSREELHAFAERVGLRRSWFQDRPRLWHYDILSQRLRARAVRLGAVLVSPRQIVRVAKPVEPQEKRDG
jgi:hypothetical protein